MINLIDRSNIRYLCHRPSLYFMLVIAIAVGVAVIVAVDLAVSNAQRALQMSLDYSVGRTTHQIVSGPGGVDEHIYRRLRTELGCRLCAPVIDTYGQIEKHTVRLLGVDLFAETGLRTHTKELSGPILRRLLTEPGAALVSKSVEQAFQLTKNQSFKLMIAGHRYTMTMVGRLPDTNARSIPPGYLIIVDLATAQEAAAMAGRLSRIDLRVDNDRQLARIKDLLPAGAHIVATAARSRAAKQLSASFDINLRAMSLLALAVGMFLIYNSMTFAVLQRRAWIGSLRAIGATRNQIFLAIFKEALASGLIGTVLGIIGGWLLGNALLHIVTRTISDHYFVVNVTQTAISPVSVLKGLSAGILATLLAAAVPAVEAARTTPQAGVCRSSLEIGMRRRYKKFAVTGALLIIFGAIVEWGSDTLLAGFVSLFLVMFGITLMVPLIASALTAKLIQVLYGRLGVQSTMALRSIVSQSSRTGIAMAALMLALAAAIGTGVMVHSFRLTVTQWLGDTLQADVYVSLPGMRATVPSATIEPDLFERLVHLPHIARFSTGRSVRIDDNDGRPLQIFALGLSPGLEPRYRLKEGNPSRAWKSFLAGDAVLISEPLAYHRHLKVGDMISMNTDRGRHGFPIAGVYYDYSSESGEVLIHRQLYDQYFHDRGYGGIGLYLASDARLGNALQAIHRAIATYAGHQQLLVRSNRELRDLSLAIFDRTFAVTEVLRLLAIAVAIIGIISALMALNLERAREFALLRALGFTRFQISNMTLIESAYIGLLAGLLAIPSGLTLSQLLIHVINHRAFGWSLQSHIASGELVQAVALAIGAAATAALYPGWKNARSAPAVGLREE